MSGSFSVDHFIRVQYGDGPVPLLPEKGYMVVQAHQEDQVLYYDPTSTSFTSEPQHVEMVVDKQYLRSGPIPVKGLILPADLTIHVWAERRGTRYGHHVESFTLHSEPDADLDP
jgi:hypothetical protein